MIIKHDCWWVCRLYTIHYRSNYNPPVQHHILITHAVLRRCFCLGGKYNKRIDTLLLKSLRKLTWILLICVTCFLWILGKLSLVVFSFQIVRLKYELNLIYLTCAASQNSIDLNTSIDITKRLYSPTISFISM